MINVSYCSDLNRLALKLISTLQLRRPDDPFKPVRIIVPNRDISRWLSMRVAETMGISANIEFLLPSEWIWSLIRDGFPNVSDILPTDRDPMRWTLFELFGQDDFVGSFPELQGYISSINPENRDLYRWQLAGHISSSFDQYQNYRPEMLKKWESGQKPKDTLGKWQAVLWSRLKKQLESGTTLENDFSRADFYNWLLESGPGTCKVEHKTLYLFNPGLMSRPFLQTLSRYSEQREVFIYSIGFRNSQQKTEYYSELRQAFGSNLSLNRTMMQDYLPGLAVTDLEGTPSGGKDTVLSQIKSSIRNNQPFPVINEPDSSVSIHACHSRYREIESLYKSILEALSDNPDLHVDDILVITPNIEHYKAYIHSVFSMNEDGLPSVPCSVALPENSADQLSNTFLDFLQLIDSRFELSDIISFISKAPIMERYSFTPSDIKTIRRWFKDNRVEWGYSSQHRKWHQQPETDIHTWSLALKRGWLGQIASEKPGEKFNGSLAYTGIESNEEQLTWARIQKMLGLFSDASDFVKESHTKHEWTDQLKNWVTQLFSSDAETNDKNSENLYAGLEDFESKLMISVITEKLPFSILRDGIKEQFETPKTGPVFFNRGVTFSSMVPVRSIPYKFIGILGMNNGEFPRKERIDSSLDLIQRNPLPGERDRRAEDQSLFLESLLASQRFFWCSYIGRDSQDDQQLAPSSVLQEFIRHLSQRSGLPESELVQHEKLHGFSPYYFQNPSPQGISKTYKQSAESVFKAPKSKGFYSSEESIQSRHTDPHIHSKQIESFFRHPLKSFCKDTMDIDLNDAWGIDSQTEFDLPPLDRTIISNSISGWILDGRKREDILDILLETGILPYGRQGERAATSLVNYHADVFTYLQQSGHTLNPALLEIDTVIGDSRISGSCASYSRSELLDVSISAKNGGRLLSAWVRHLLVSSARTDHSGDSYSIYRSGYESFEVVTFKPVTNPVPVLEDLLKIFLKGQEKPMPFFPNTAYVYTDLLIKGVDEQTALDRAVSNTWAKWSPYTGGLSGDQTDPYTEFLYGPSTPLEGKLLDEFNQISMAIFPAMINHLSEHKIN